MTDVEYMLMVDYRGVGGLWGTEARFRRNTSEAAVIDEVKRTLPHAVRVEVFRREVAVPWEKVEVYDRRSGHKVLPPTRYGKQGHFFFILHTKGRYVGY